MSSINRLLRIKQVLEVVPYSKSKIWDDVSKGKFPKPLKLSDRVTCWRESDIFQWLEEKGV
jgi:prophage regulatory protein